jgi:hypothetical protein
VLQKDACLPKSRVHCSSPWLAGVFNMLACRASVQHEMVTVCTAQPRNPAHLVALVMRQHEFQIAGALITKSGT